MCINRVNSVFIGEISWGEESLNDLCIENSFGKKFSKEDKIDVVMGADVIFWPESIDGLLKTLNVRKYNISKWIMFSGSIRNK